MDCKGDERWGQTPFTRDEWPEIGFYLWAERRDEPNGHQDRLYGQRASPTGRTPFRSPNEFCYLRRVTWSHTVAPPPPIAAPMSAPFLPPTAAPTPAPTPAEEPMMIALLATDRVFFTGRSS